MAFSPDETLLASGGGYYAKSIKVWKLASKKLYHELKGSEGAVTTVAFSPDGKTLVSSGDDYVVRFWDMESGKDKFAD